MEEKRKKLHQQKKKVLINHFTTDDADDKEEKDKRGDFILIVQGEVDVSNIEWMDEVTPMVSVPCCNYPCNTELEELIRRNASGQARYLLDSTYLTCSLDDVNGILRRHVASGRKGGSRPKRPLTKLVKSCRIQRLKRTSLVHTNSQGLAACHHCICKRGQKVQGCSVWGVLNASPRTDPDTFGRISAISDSMKDMQRVVHPVSALDAGVECESPLVVD